MGIARKIDKNRPCDFLIQRHCFHEVGETNDRILVLLLEKSDTLKLNNFKACNQEENLNCGLFLFSPERPWTMKSTVKTRCFAYAGKNCSALNHLYCRSGECGTRPQPCISLLLYPVQHYFIKRVVMIFLFLYRISEKKFLGQKQHRKLFGMSIAICYTEQKG